MVFVMFLILIRMGMVNVDVHICIVREAIIKI